MQIIAQVIRGSHGDVLVRQKSGSELELGDLLVSEDASGEKTILQVFDLCYGSQMEDKTLELASGTQLEGFSHSTQFIDQHLRSYILARVKTLIEVNAARAHSPKSLPKAFSNLRQATSDDLRFLQKQDNTLLVGFVRSGSKTLNAPLYLNARDTLSHHVLIPASTGKGKSNLVKNMLYSVLDDASCGIIVLDAHDEYYGRAGNGLKNHPQAQNFLKYYSSNPKPGANSLLLNIQSIKPWHFRGAIDFTEPQEQACYSYYKKYGGEWIKRVLSEKPTDKDSINELRAFGQTVAVLQRKLSHVLDATVTDNEVRFGKTFVEKTGETTVEDVVSAVEKGKKIVLDASSLSSESELLIGSVLAHALLDQYKTHLNNGVLATKPVASIVLEEAPRVLSENRGSNVFSTIAREGRKFNVGLIAVTQLTSVIPKEILANLSTKIILGNEMQSERRAIIDNACQDLTTEDKTIASLDKGEAIVSSMFTKFAVPVAIPDFNETVKQAQNQAKKGFV